MFDRKGHWQKVYSEKSPLEVSWYQKDPLVSLQLIERCELTKDQALIDVGGGASVLVDHLLAKGYKDLSVLDIAAQSMEHARVRLADKADTVQWLEADVTEFHSTCRYALWHDRAVFHFLIQQQDRINYVDVLRRALQPGGFIIIAAFAIGGPTQCSGLNIEQYDAKKLLAVLGESFQLLEQCAERHLTPAGKEQLFHYFRLQYKP